MERTLGASEENWTRCTAGGTGIGVFGIVLRTSIGRAHVLAATKATCERHAVLRSHILPGKPSKLQIRQENFAPVVESMPWPLDFNNEAPPGMLVLPGENAEENDRNLSRALHEIVTSELNIPFSSEDRSPVDVFQVHFYEEPSGCGCILILRLHSGACDRHSGVIVAGEFLSHLDAAAADQPPSIDNVGDDGRALLPSMEDLAPKSSKGFFKKGIDALGYAINSSKSSLLPFQSGFEKNQQPFRSEIASFSLGQPGTAELLDACKREKTSLSAALSAAFLKVAANVKELKQKKLDTFSFTKVLNCRPYFDPPLADTVIGNYSAGLPADEQVKDNVELWDLARHISAATDKSLAKSHQFTELPVLNMLLSQVLKHPNITPSSSMRTALFTLFVDGPAECKWGKDVSNLDVVGTIGPIASMHLVGPCFIVADSLLEGPELVLTFLFTTPMYSRAQLYEFLASSLELLKTNALGTSRA